MSFFIKPSGWLNFGKKLTLMKKTSKTMIFRATEEATLYAHAKLPGYPTQRIGSSYRRTGDLGRSFTTDVKPINNGAVGTLGTNIVYAPDVVSTKMVRSRGPQKKMHKGRWWLLQRYIQHIRPDIVKIFERVTNKVVGGR